MTRYSRPAISTQLFCDAAGEVIRYGQRWQSGLSGTPPGDSYSVTSHPERFLPLLSVANALITHLVDSFEVTVSDDVAHAAELLHTRDDIIRAVRLTPSAADGAPLTFVFTSFPSVIVVAGALTEMLFPDCGCDACDEEWESQAHQLEWQVLAVVGGLLRERQPREGETRFQSASAAVDGSATHSASSIMVGMATPARLEMARAALAEHPNGWGAWRPKS